LAKPEFKLLPCVFCTIGFNSYVAVNKLANVTLKKIKRKNNQIIDEDDKNNRSPSINT